MPKEILNDMNGVFKQGMNAILGPTGGGKSSLLDVLAGRKEPTGLSGSVLVDGKRQPKNFKCMTGYVVQDDVVMGTLTVRENFMFSANLRLSSDISQSVKKAKVEEVIQELGLSACADSKIGTEFIRGVSGGERKRTNIGMELIISPGMLFLDEPTTGLDASTANAVMSLLHRLSKRGRTIIFSIHQPRYAIFKLFDRLMLLAAGRTIYHGPAQEALSYFSSIGYECEEHNNPSDFFLDVINGDSTAVQLATKVEEVEAQHGNMKETISNIAIENGEAVVEVEPVQSSLAFQLSDKYLNSPWSKRVNDEINPIEEAYVAGNHNKSNTKVRGEYTTGFLTQLRYVAKRTVLNIIRNPQTSVLQLVIILFFALIVGVIYLQLNDNIDSAIQNRVGAFFFIIMNQVFGNLSAVELFIKERSIFVHESASGFYRVSAYFFAKVFCDLVPMRLVPLSAFCIITYFMIGLQMYVEKFFIFYLSLFLTTMAASAIGFCVGASVRVFAIANLLIALCYVIMMVFGGLLVNLNTMADWLSWLQYLSIIRYSLNTLSINELKDLDVYSYVNDTKILIPNAGIEYLEKQGINYETAWDLWQNIMALGIITIGIMFLAYIQLRRIPKLK